MDGDPDNVLSLTTFAAKLARDEVLARRHKIRREGGFPDYYAKELRRRHPLKANIGRGGHELHYRRGPWRKLDHGHEDEPAVRQRTTHGWIVHAGQKVGAVEFREIDAELIDSFAFFDALDNESDRLCGIAEAVLSCWPDVAEHLTGYGQILLLDHVWLDRRHPDKGIWETAAKRLIAEIEEQCSIVLTRLFPVEYGGRVPDDDAPSNLGLGRRQRAMGRVAERRLGLRPLPLPSEADDGRYYWRPCRGLDIEPDYHADWRRAYAGGGAELPDWAANDP